MIKSIRIIEDNLAELDDDLEDLFWHYEERVFNIREQISLLEWQLKDCGKIAKIKNEFEAVCRPVDTVMDNFRAHFSAATNAIRALKECM
jgi:hypothetical protein